MKRLFAITALVVVTAAGFVGREWWIRHRQPAAAARPEVQPVGSIYKIAENLYVIPKGGGNTAVFVTSQGVVLVDTKLHASWQLMMNEVKKVTDKPVTHVINTHCHGDHAGGNELFPETVEIIAQENTGKELVRMRKESRSEKMWGIATRTYTDQLTLFSGDEAVDVYYFGPAHTGGDSLVVFRSARVMHAGDLFPDKIAPVINTNRGGDGVAYGETMGNAATAIKGVDRVITGHGAVLPWSDFEDYGEFNRALLEQAKSSISSGQDEYHAVANLKLPDKFKGYNLDKTINTFDQIYKRLGK